MASGGSDTVQGASDAIYDYTCSLCDSDNLNNEATVYCGECAEMLCTKCEKFHSKFQATHKVLDKTNVPQWGVVKRKVSMVTCEEHPGEGIKMWCRSHDKVCCTVCAFKYHRSCKKVDYIPDVAESERQTNNIEDLPKKAARIATKLRKTLGEKYENRDSLKESRQIFIEALDKIQREFNDEIERLKKATLDDMSELAATLDKTIQSEVDSINKIDGEIEYFTKLVNKQETLESSAAYVSYKMCDEKMAEAESLLVKIKRNRYDVAFEHDVSIRKSLALMRSFGQFRTKTTMQPLNALRSTSYNVRATRDKYTCEICGLCQLPSGHVLAVDRKNQNVKLLNDKMTTVDVYTPPKYPQCLCPIGDHEAAVAVNKMNKRHETHILKVQNNKIVYVKMFPVNHDCFGIFHRISTLYVASLTAIYSYTMGGKLIKKIYEDTSSEMTVGTVTVSDDGTKIYSRNFNAKQLYTLDQEGTLLSIFTDPFIRRPNYITLTDDGSLLVSCWQSKTIVQLDSEGRKKLATVATATDGVNIVYCLWFDRSSSRLLVGQKTTDDIIVLQLG